MTLSYYVIQKVPVASIQEFLVVSALRLLDIE